MEKKDKDGKRSNGKLPDLRHGVHGALTSGGLVGEEKGERQVHADGGEVATAPGSKLPAGQTSRM